MITLVFEVLFITLVILDLVLTYKVIRSGKGYELAFARYYIKYPLLTYGITIAGAGAIILLAELGQFYWPMIVACVAFAWACWNNWEVLHG